MTAGLMEHPTIEHVPSPPPGSGAVSLATRPLDRRIGSPEFARILDELTRRRFLAGGLGAATLAGLAGCSNSGRPAGGTRSAAAGSWTYRDDLGRSISLRSKPARVATVDDGIAATLWAAGVRVVAAPLIDGNRPFLSGAGIPRTGVTALQSTDGLNVERLVAAHPDVIIDSVNDGKLRVSSRLPQVAKIAPVIGMNTTGPTVDAIIRTAHRLVDALGISPADAQARADSQVAATTLEHALAAKPGLRAIFCFADGSTGLDVMVADKWPFMQTLAGFGLQMVESGIASAGAAGYFRQVSWENVPSLPVDLVIYTGVGLPKSNPSWQAMPAVKTGQYLDSGVGWYAYYYSNYVTMLGQLTAVIHRARTGVGPA